MCTQTANFKMCSYLFLGRGCITIVVGLARCNKSLSMIYMSLTDSYSVCEANRSLYETPISYGVQQEHGNVVDLLLNPGDVQHIALADDFIEAGVFRPRNSGLGSLGLNILWHRQRGRRYKVEGDRVERQELD
jgi:hypothetical protein